MIVLRTILSFGIILLAGCSEQPRREELQNQIDELEGENGSLMHKVDSAQTTAKEVESSAAEAADAAQHAKAEAEAE